MRLIQQTELHTQGKIKENMIETFIDNIKLLQTKHGYILINNNKIVSDKYFNNIEDAKNYIQSLERGVFYSG